MAATPSSKDSPSVMQPNVVKFAFTDLTIDKYGDKWSAKCKICKAVLSEKKGTTSAFTKWVDLT
jgi:hypothetical protein